MQHTHLADTTLRLPIPMFTVDGRTGACEGGSGSGGTATISTVPNFGVILNPGNESPQVVSIMEACEFVCCMLRAACVTKL